MFCRTVFLIYIYIHTNTNIYHIYIYIHIHIYIYAGCYFLFSIFLSVYYEQQLLKGTSEVTPKPPGTGQVVRVAQQRGGGGQSRRQGQGQGQGPAAALCCAMAMATFWMDKCWDFNGKLYIPTYYITICLVVWAIFYFFHILGRIIPTDFHFFRGVETTNQSW